MARLIRVYGVGDGETLGYCAVSDHVTPMRLHAEYTKETEDFEVLFEDVDAVFYDCTHDVYGTACVAAVSYIKVLRIRGRKPR